jgi:IclR family acetate operon transcriptional repressor
MLTTLQSLGYVEHGDQSQGYSPSLKMVELAGKILQKVTPIEAAKPFMIQLADQTQETVNLGILDGIDVICVDKVESKHHLRMEQPTGTRAKAYETAMGKAVLAFLDEEERFRLLHEHTITRSTAHSLGSIVAIEKDLEGARGRGYSFDNEESIVGVRCVGAPIFDHTSRVIGALSVAGPAVRMGDKQMARFGRLVGKTAEAISRQLGYDGTARRSSDKSASRGGETMREKL